MKKIVFALMMVMVFAFATTSFAFYTSSSSYQYGANAVIGNNGSDIASIKTHDYGNKNGVEVVRQNVIDNSVSTKYTDTVQKTCYPNYTPKSTNKTLNYISGNNGSTSGFIYNQGSHNVNRISINKTNIIDNSVTHEYIKKK